ncbi:hypothetical protein HPC49_11420 [Pyxidicoccus fallax]|uniref:Uncharacterized protein n=1 Tax=Pyxidicoccus fallax TaxID=394095 RepID=A0A848LEY7_9BACT|nr:hypothetical protein [Pyxidicoccus fallax]NMO17066.1 hypothetical protein [Pyxidicoccus fallax]NPC78848.1 hypothetical protein [Pyxidicoccus fallax]
MKWLSIFDMKPEDCLYFSFEADFDPEAPLERELEPFLHALETYADAWMPQVVQGKRVRKYSRAAFFKGLEEERGDRSTSLGLYRKEWPGLSTMFSLWIPPPAPSRLYFGGSIKPISVFADVRHCEQLVDLVCAWAAHYPVAHAWAHSVAESQLSGSPDFGRDSQTTIRDGFDRVYEVSWLNVFGPKLVASIGRERVLSTPAHRVEELPNGAVLLVTWPIAADFARDEARQAQARAHSHLRPDLDYDTLLRTLRERSAILAPVEPRFPPELEPLLTRVVDRVLISERQLKIAELNAWRPPEPDEWLPASAALPPDVKDVDFVREQYNDLAEGLVALLHTDVPSVFEASPQSLMDVDAHFWCEDFLRNRLPEVVDEHLMPAVGAYLGEVLVKHLGGQWIPRKRLEEAQVRVGDRVWLPFLRAHRYTRSRQALLDSSLSGFYLAAERHRA